MNHITQNDRDLANSIAAAHPIRTGACIARGNHLAAQNDEPELTRSDKLMEARALTRSARITTDAELFQALSNIRASCAAETHYTQLLDEVLLALDSDLNAPDEPVESYYKGTVGEFDAATKGVKGRA